MKLTTYEAENVGYLALCEIADGGVARSVDVSESITLDFDTEGALLGIESLNANRDFARIDVPIEKENR